MVRKSFGKKITAIYLALGLMLSAVACGDGDIPTSGAGASGSAGQGTQEGLAAGGSDEAGEDDSAGNGMASGSADSAGNGAASGAAGSGTASGVTDGTGSGTASGATDGTGIGAASGASGKENAAAAQLPSGYGLTPENGNPDLNLEIRPEVPYWFPAQILEWNPEEDESLPFHQSNVPLAGRRGRDSLDTVNSTQNLDTKVMALSIMNRNTSGNIPRWGNTAQANVFSYWQYVDTLVYWGGSSGEGLIVPPAADVVDAGHRNGVKVLGTVFMPQTAHGGKMEWLEDLLSREKDGSFPVADKLIQAARVYGFDGWFINQETEGTEEEPLTKEHADRMKEFLAYCKTQAPELELVYYDSMTEEGRMAWQNALTEKNAGFLKAEGRELADEMFVNFGWSERVSDGRERLAGFAALAGEKGIDPYDLYAGVDLQSNGYMTSVNWNLFEDPEGGTLTSLGLYCPSWAFSSARDMEDFRKKENTLWVNQEGDPSAETAFQNAYQWRGISHYVAERTAVTSLPFVTNFCMGNGYSFFKNGCGISLSDWNNRSLSDILPTYRYRIDNGEGNLLSADLDMEDAWYGGSSLLLSGTMKQDVESRIRLYSAELTAAEQMIFTVTARASGAEIALDAVLEWEDGSEALLQGDQPVGSAWTTVSYDMAGLAGKGIRAISFRLAADRDTEDLALRLGNITIAEDKQVQDAKINGLQIIDSGFDEDAMYAGVRLCWEAEWDSAPGGTFVGEISEGSGTREPYYEIYRIGPDQNRYLAAVSNTQSCYLDALPRMEGEGKTVLEVVPVNWRLEEGTPVQAVLEWPDNTLPKAGFTADVTLAAPGDTVTFRSLCSQNTEKVSWTLTGADKESAQGEEVSVSYSQEGVYPVSVKAENASGSDEASVEAYIVITKEASGGLSLLSQGAAVTADAYVNENEAPGFAADGDKGKKWCATGNGPHEITLDLGEVRTISAVDIYHAEAGGESPDMNTRAYTILVSRDGEDFTEVCAVAKNTAGTTHDAFAPCEARFVRLRIDEATQGSDSAARIYEVEVYGLGD